MEKTKKYIIVGVVVIISLIAGLSLYYFKLNKDAEKEEKTTTKVEEKLNEHENAKLKEGITDSFYVTIGSTKHTVDIVYTLNIENNTVGYNTNIYFDNKKIENYISTYKFASSIVREEPYISKEEAENFTLKDLKEKTKEGKITSNGIVDKDDFKIIKGTNGKEYIGLYSYVYYEDSKVSEKVLYILDLNGNLVTKLYDYDGYSLSNTEKTLNYKSSGEKDLLDGRNFTKIEGNNIYFYAATFGDKITAYEYKLTLGDTLKFEKINTYNNVDISGGERKNTKNGLNTIMPQEENKNNASNNEANSYTLKNGIADLFLLEVNGENHRINIVYLMEENNGSYGYKTNLYYDNKKIDSYNSMYTFNNNNSKEDIEKYTINSLKDTSIEKRYNGTLAKDDFKIIKGTNNKDYIGIYSYNYNENYKLAERILYILDENGNIVTKLVDYDNYSLSNTEKTLEYSIGTSSNSLLEGKRFTKIEGNEIYFYSTTFEGIDKPSSITANEYKMTLGNTPKFEKINTYNNLDISGGERKNTRNGLNTIVK